MRLAVRWRVCRTTPSKDNLVRQRDGSTRMAKRGTYMGSPFHWNTMDLFQQV